MSGNAPNRVRYLSFFSILNTVQAISNSTTPAKANSNLKGSILKKKKYRAQKLPRLGTRFSFLSPLGDEHYNLDKKLNEQVRKRKVSINTKYSINGNCYWMKKPPTLGTWGPVSWNIRCSAIAPGVCCLRKRGRKKERKQGHQALSSNRDRSSAIL